MTPAPPAAGSRRRRPAVVVLLLLLPAIPWLAAALVAAVGGRLERVPTEQELRSTAGPLASSFTRLLGSAADVTTAALRASPREALHEGRHGPWGARLEGVGVAGPDGELLSWDGTPEGAPVPAPRATKFMVAIEGIRVRLQVTTVPNELERYATASFILDSSLGDLPFQALIPPSVTRRHLVDAEFLDGRAVHEDVNEFFGASDGVFRGGETPVLYVPLRSPSGQVLAVAKIQRVRQAHRATALRAEGAAGSAVVLACVLVGVFPWGRLCRAGPGTLAAVAAVGVGRGALLLTRAPAVLLPRGLGSPSLYGTAHPLGLLASPADFALTGLALLLAALALATWSYEMRRAGRRGWALAMQVAGFALLLTVVAALSVSLAKHSRLDGDLFEHLPEPLGQAALLAGVVLVILGGAALGALALEAVARVAPGPTARGRRRLVAGLLLLPGACVASLFFLSSADRLGQERLRSEFAPHVLDQSARRRISLRAAVASAAESDVARDAVLAPASRRDHYAAYRLWAAGELFHAGYKSSLDLYDATGDLVSHFGFGLPPFEEKVAPAGEPEGMRLRDEGFPATLAVEQRLVHAEQPIVQNGAVVGMVVGHVLDEPENLPFLPSVGPYLAALGPDAPPRSGRAPDYVVYDADDRVVLSTLLQPPALTPELRDAADRRETVDLRTGDEGYVGLALAEAGRVHLLLLPARPWLDRLAILAKLFVIALGMLAAVALLRTAWRNRGFGFVVRGIRESFHNKLVATLLLASLVPVVGLALFLGGYLERRADDQLAASAAQVIGVVQRVIKDYAAVESDEVEPADLRFDDEILYWLRRVVGQEIHLYEHGTLEASSKRELFTSGLLSPCLPGRVERRVVIEGRPVLTVATSLGPTVIPVAYTRVDLPGTHRQLVAAVPLILQQQETARATERVEEMLVLTTVLLVVLLLGTTALLARTVARPVRELVAATGRIAAGDYSARLRPRSADEMAELVRKFNAMADALSRQRADLERRRDYMQALLTNATTGVLSTDASGRIVTLNPAAERLLGRGAEPPRVGEPLDAALARNPALEPLARALRTAPAGPGEPAEVDLAPEGDPVRLRCVRVPLPDPTGDAPGRLLLVDDVTDLMRSNQLAAWAEMAQAIAHEIKNPLTPIQLSTEHLERLLEDREALPSPEIESCLETIMKQVQALREIAAEFSAYAKLPSLAPEPTDAADFMKDVLAPYRAAHHPRVRLLERYARAPAVLIDRRVLSRAIVNLVENAFQAMPEGGELTVSVAPDPGGDGTVLAVEDTGPGLSPGVRARLFEPYFSTKSSGTGLGLAIVRRAVEAHAGRIEIDSRPGRGTAFRIRLAAVRSSATSTEPGSDRA